MINIKSNNYNLNFNNIGYNCITGTNFEVINEVIYSIDSFFGGKKDTMPIFSISEDNIKLNKKDYIYLKFSPLLHSTDEVEIAKTSYIKKIISDITDTLDENSRIFNRLTNAISNEFENNKDIFNYSKLNSVSDDLDNIKLQFSVSEVNKKIFLDSILNMQFTKNGNNINFFTNYEITNIVLNIIKIFLSMNTDKKVFILFDNIEYKMNNIEKEKILEKILSICDDRCCILHFVENISSKNNKYILERTTIVNDITMSNFLDDKTIRDIQDSFPAHLEYDKLIELYSSFIVKYHQYLSNKHYHLIRDTLSIDNKKILYSINDVFKLDIDNIL